MSPLCAQAALIALLVAGCATHRPPPAAAATAASVGVGEFTVAENMLDTWNTIGKILVGLDDVGYEGRAQMLGIYAVRYRGERFLLRTQAIVLPATARHAITRVVAIGLDGKPLRSAATMALLATLQQRFPLEVGKYRQPIRLPGRSNH